MNIEWTQNFVPHDSHQMSRWRSLVRTPANTPRIYSVRECKSCGLEHGSSVAGEYYERGLENRCLEIEIN